MDGEVTQLITLRIDVTNTGQALDAKDVVLTRNDTEEDRIENLSVGRGETSSQTLEWQTEAGDAGSWTVAAESPDDGDTVDITLFAPLEVASGETVQAADSDETYSAIRFAKDSALQYQNDQGVTVRNLHQ